jgi:addiction module HigA family antidote
VAAYDFSDFVCPLPHPGEHLREEFLSEYNLMPGALAKAMGRKDRTRIERLIRGQQSITADTALRLAKVFGTSPSSGSTCKLATTSRRPR